MDSLVKELADSLGVAENTVKAQIRSLLKKSGARSLATLAQKVIKGATRDTVPPEEADGAQRLSVCDRTSRSCWISMRLSWPTLAAWPPATIETFDGTACSIA